MRQPRSIIRALTISMCRALFIDEDLADWLRSRYAEQARAAATPRGTSACFTSDQAAVTGGRDSPHQDKRRYAALLARKTRKRPKSTKQS